MAPVENTAVSKQFYIMFTFLWLDLDFQHILEVLLSVARKRGSLSDRTECPVAIGAELLPLCHVEFKPRLLF